jgi:type I restriction enzyme S subunit|tara:strand:- start:7663 stop:9027 length:1365 start_codon:yes stop_codon:yes gene_type:complete
MSFPKYESYVDSGLEWLGSVPSHWTVKRLGHFFEERREKVSDKDFAPLSVTMKGIVPRLETAAKTQDGENRKKVLEGDFVINSRSDRKGSSGVAPQDGSVSLICIVARPKGIEPYFAHHLLRSVPFQEEFYRYGKGIVADLWSTGYSEMKNIVIPVPPSPEQQEIAAFLDHETAKIDALIAEQQRLIELLKEKRQAVISHAVTKGLNLNAPMKDSGVEWLGEVPAHWEVSRLRWYATIQGGLAKGKFYASEKETVELPYLRVANVQNGHFNLDTVHTVEIAKKEVDRYLLKQGDVLMNEGGDNDKLGRGAVWNTEIDPCLHQNHVFAIRPERGLSSDWLAVFTQSESARAYFYLHSKQSTNLASISSSNVMSCWIPIPPEDEQDQIMEVLKESSTKLEEMVLASQEGIRLLGERRSALISAAVTGKIDVRGWRPSESASPELVLQAAEEAASCG